MKTLTRHLIPTIIPIAIAAVGFILYQPIAERRGEKNRFIEVTASKTASFWADITGNQTNDVEWNEAINFAKFFAKHKTAYVFPSPNSGLFKTREEALEYARKNPNKNPLENFVSEIDYEGQTLGVWDLSDFTEFLNKHKIGYAVASTNCLFKTREEALEYARKNPNQNSTNNSVYEICKTKDGKVGQILRVWDLNGEQIVSEI